MTHSGDISVDFIAVRQPNTGHFAKSRVGLLGSRGKHAQAHSPPLRALGQIRRTGSRLLGLSAFAYQLLNRRHATSASFVARPYSTAVVFNIFARAAARQFFLTRGFVRRCSLQKIPGLPRANSRLTPETKIPRTRVSVTKGAEEAKQDARCTAACALCETRGPTARHSSVNPLPQPAPPKSGGGTRRYGLLFRSRRILATC